jgi:hypothetical protein
MPAGVAVGSLLTEGAVWRPDKLWHTSPPLRQSPQRTNDRSTNLNNPFSGRRGYKSHSLVVRIPMRID